MSYDAIKRTVLRRASIGSKVTILIVFVIIGIAVASKMLDWSIEVRAGSTVAVLLVIVTLAWAYEKYWRIKCSACQFDLTGTIQMLGDKSLEGYCPSCGKEIGANGA